MSTKNNAMISLVVFSLFLLSFQAGAQVRGQSTTPPSGIANESELEIEESAQETSSEPVVKEVVISEDEFPSESVTPITDNKSNVLNKKIKFTKRFQLDLNTGSILDEPIVNTNYYLIKASYYVSEEYSFGVGIRSRFGGKTTYSEQLYQGSAQLDFDRAPSPTQSHFVSFGYSFYYGKISLGKNIVVPALTKLDTDFGMQSFGSTTKPFIQSAVNQSFFITNHLSLGLSIGLSLAQTLDPTSVNIRLTQPVPNQSNFSDKIQFNQYLSLNLGMIL